jgi:energy-coupling factor transport system permease protein
MTAHAGQRSTRAHPAWQRRHAGLHPLAWASWLGAGLFAIFLTSNPLYLTTLALVALIVYMTVRSRATRSMDYMLVAGLLLASLTIPLNLLTGSSGLTTLFTLPAITLPGWLGHVVLGGEVTAESFVMAATQALSIAAVLVFVCAFTLGVDHLRLLRSLPGAVAQLGIVGSVGLLLLPETLARARSLREARIVRGHRDRGGAAVLSMALPLLANALERSLQRAESLDARGFGRLAPQRHALQAVAGIAGLAIAAIGLFASYYTEARALPLAVAVAGGTLVVGALLINGGERASRLYRTPLSTVDVAVIATAVAGGGAFLLARALAAGDISYLPFPEVGVPAYAPALAAACLLFAAPALAAMFEGVDE